MESLTSYPRVREQPGPKAVIFVAAMFDHNQAEADIVHNNNDECE
jgi:hypothetical protein